jgi:hypothetical protein
MYSTLFTPLKPCQWSLPDMKPRLTNIPSATPNSHEFGYLGMNKPLYVPLPQTALPCILSTIGLAGS